MILVLSAAMVHDLKGQIRYLRAHADELNIDPAEMYKQADAPESSRSALIGYTGEEQGLYVLRGQMGNPGSPYVNPDADKETQEALHRAYLAAPLNFVKDQFGM